MRKNLFVALALAAAFALGTFVYESSAFAQNSNSSTTNNNMSGSMSGKHMGRRHRRHRRHRRMRHRMNKEMKGNANH